MKRRLLLILSLVIALSCIFAFSVSAECEHQDSWSISTGSNGYLGSMSAVNTCPSCGETLATENLDPMFETLGYSYSDNGIMQHYAVNRDVIARYEELTGEAVKFGAVTATRNHVSGNPLDNEGNPVNNKVFAVDFTSTKYDVFDVVVRGIPDSYKSTTEIFCCAYIIVNGNVTYINNYAEKQNAVALTYNKVEENYNAGIFDETDVEQVMVVNGVRYRALTPEELGLGVGAFWNSTDENNYKYITKTTTGTDLASKFAYTQMLTRDSIPVGSIITIADGWQYRPEFWINDAKNAANVRPGNVKTSTVYVTEAWWSNYTTRAFNIATTSTNVLYGNKTVEEINEIFKIFVPESAVIPASPVALKQAWDEDGSLKILTIGNSFSDDAMEYVYYIAKALGVEDVELGNLRANSCSLATHLSNAQNDTPYYMYRHWANGDTKWVDDGSWSSNGTYKISTAVANTDWDFIVFQQVSSSSADASSYDSVNELMAIVENLNPSARLAWHMTWGYKATTDLSMYNNIVNAVQTKIVGNEEFDVIIPVGTTIQNARTSYLNLNDLMRNNHLGYGLGRYAAGLTFVKALTGLSIDNVSFVPTADTEGHTFNYPVQYKDVIIEAVNNAIAKPFEVTNTTHNEISDVDLSELVQVDYLGLNKWAYYDSTNEDFLFEAITNKKLSGMSGENDYFYYFSTRMFSKEQLPVGSVIVVESGWKYRPEGWVDSETLNETRPENVTTKYILVTEEWWGNYTVRAFNISENPWVNQKFLLSTTEEEIKQIFKIYVPASAVEKNVEGSEYEPQPTNPAFPEDGDNSSTVVGSGKVSADSVVDEIVVINGKRYKALTMEAMGLAQGFYNSNSGPWLSTSRSDYAATKQFTKDDLLNGMIIWAGNGATVRPEGWISLEGTNARNENISGPFTIEITDAFWSTYYKSLTNTSTLDTPYTVRGFNYSKGSSSLETVYNNFKIYVPLELIEGHKQILSSQVVEEETLLDTNGDGVGDLRVKALTMEAMGLAQGFYNSNSGPWLSTSRSDYAATKQFTKDDLLNGMIIWAGNGATVRPEGWISLEGTNARNENISGPFTIEITDAFWSTYYKSLTNTSTLDTPYTVRGFNYSKGGSSLEQVYNNFKIYVPIDMIAE